jgi:hypothetical protein
MSAMVYADEAVNILAKPDAIGNRRGKLAVSVNDL